MSHNYEKYKAMSPERLQKAIDDREVTLEYLGWLGITDKGQLLREAIKNEV